MTERKDTAFSEFIRNASEEEKKEVYGRVMEEASKAQQAVMEDHCKSQIEYYESPFHATHDPATAAYLCIRWDLMIFCQKAIKPKVANSEPLTPLEEAIMSRKRNLYP